MIRTLPLRVTPLPGEALDSWLETVASRHRVVLGEILAASGIEYNRRPFWLASLAEEQVYTLSALTGVEPAAVEAMTLSNFNGRALEIEGRGTDLRLAPGFPFGTRWRSRYCPRCLSESGGRWQLAWRLGWSFACTKHRCLLADVCPQCERIQRYLLHPLGVVPNPGFCGLSAGGRRHSRCGADLSSSQVLAGKNMQELIDAQAVIFRIISDGEASFGVYDGSPRPSRSVLADIKTFVVRILAHAKSHGVDNVLEEGDTTGRDATGRLADHLDEPLRWRYIRNTDYRTAPESAFDTALGISAAFRVVSATSIDEAAERLRRLTVSSSRGYPAGLRPHPADSVLATAINIKACQPYMGARLQLRYRASLPMPTAPEKCDTDAAVRAARVASRLPSLLWPAWSVRFVSGESNYDQRRMALSCAVVLVGAQCATQAALEWLGKHTSNASVGQLLELMRKSDYWEATALAVDRLNCYLHGLPSSVIDYQQRRRLDYSTLLPTATWLRICQETGTPPGIGQKETVARFYLFEVTSGSPARSAPWENPYPTIGRVFWTRVKNFPFMLTPHLAAALGDEGRRFLAEKKISEPLVWHPPLTLIDDLDPPNPGAEGIDTRLLRQLANSPGASTSTLSRRLGVDVNTVRHHLAENPVELEPRQELSTKRRSLLSTRFRELVNREKLYELYVVQGNSLVSIGRQFGMSETTVRRMAVSYGIPLRLRVRPDRAWLSEQYVRNRRTLGDIAQELRLSRETVRLWIHRYELPFTSNYVDTSGSLIEASEARTLLAPALRSPKGWSRLILFVECLQHASIAAAARALEREPSSLRAQIRNLEADLGGALLNRARLPLRMTPTELGSIVSQAVQVSVSEGAPGAAVPDGCH